MTTARRKRAPFSVIPRARMRRVCETTSLEGAGLYACLYACEHIRGVPGVIVAGPAAVGEQFQLSATKARTLLAELERSGWVMCDLKAPLIFVVHAIADDPAANPNVVEFSWVPRINELPESPVKVAIVNAIGQALRDTTLEKWNEITVTGNGRGERLGGPVHTTPATTVRGNPIPIPIPIPEEIPERSDGAFTGARDDKHSPQERRASPAPAGLERPRPRAGGFERVDSIAERIDAIAKRAVQ